MLCLPKLRGSSLLSIVLTLPFLAFFAGCAGTTTFVPTAGLEKEKLSSRPTPAQVTQESADALTKKGYVAIGQISRKVVTGTYWGSSKVPDKQESRDTTTKLCGDAAAKGGDLVSLTADNKPEKQQLTKQGKAIAWTTRREDRWVDYGSGGHFATVTVRTPVAWETHIGTELSIVSAGTVWRSDPDLAKRVAEREAERLAELKRQEAERQRRKAAMAVEFRKFQAQGRSAVLAWSKTLRPTRVGGKWGYVDSNGRMVIEPEFDNADGFSEGLARVRIAQKSGFIDPEGTIVIKPQFDVADRFREGLCGIGIGEKHGLIDPSGTVVVKPQFDFVSGFTEGLCGVGIGEKRGFINHSGKIVIQLQFDSGSDFSEGLAAMAVGPEDRANRWGFIDKNGAWAIGPKFYKAADFRDGLAAVASEESHHYCGYINKTGNWAIRPSFVQAWTFSEGLAAVKTTTGKMGYVGKNGEFVIEPRFEYADRFSEGLAAAMLNSKLGYIDKTGKFVIKPQFDLAFDFRDGRARVEVGEKKGFIDKSGQWLP